MGNAIPHGSRAKGSVPSAAAPAGREQKAAASAKTANTRRKSILKQQFQDGLPLRYALPLSALLVALMTWGLFHLQTFLMVRDHLPRVRPFGICYLIPVIVMTAFASRRAGWFTLFLSVLAMAFALTSHALSWQLHRAIDFVELALLAFVGSLVVNGVEAMQQNRIMFADITDAPNAQEILDSVRRAACTVPCVGVIQTCALRRRGFDIYVALDFYGNGGGEMTLAEISQAVAAVENAVYQSHPLIYQVRARIQMPPAAVLNSLSS